MNPGVHHIESLSLQPTEGCEPGIFDIEYRYSSGGLGHRAFSVHVPKRLQAAELQGEVVAFHLDAVRTALGPAALPAAKFVMLSVRLADGRNLTALPRALVWSGVPGGVVALGAAAWFASLALESQSYAFVAASAVLTHFARYLFSASGIARRNSSMSV